MTVIAHRTIFSHAGGQQITMTDEGQLIAKLQHLEALFARPTTEAERLAAANAIDLIRARIRAMEQLDPAVAIYARIFTPGVSSDERIRDFSRKSKMH